MSHRGGGGGGGGGGGPNLPSPIASGLGELRESSQTTSDLDRSEAAAGSP
jgi:hypothetical protein